jgi:hypothetical protein
MKDRHDESARRIFVVFVANALEMYLKERRCELLELAEAGGLL